MQALLNGQIKLREDEWKDLLRTVDMSDVGSAYCCILIDSGESKENSAHVFALFSTLPQICRRYLSRLHALGWIISDAEGRCLSVLQKAPKRENLYHILRGLQKHLLQHSMWKDGCIAVGKSVQKLSEICVSYDSAENAIQHRADFPDFNVIFSEDAEALYSTSSLLKEADFELAFSAFRRGEMEELRKLVTEYAEKVRAQNPVLHNKIYPSGIRRMFIELTVQILHIGSDMGLDVDNTLGGLDPYAHLMTLRGTPAIIDWFISLCGSIHEKMALAAQSNKSNIVSSAIQYIDHHLADYDLSLDAVADNIGVTGNYLSATFSKENQMTFVKYITGKRIRTAQDQLLHSQETVAQIAANCGFSSVEYFNRVFKKATGTTPSIYRKAKEQNNEN